MKRTLLLLIIFLLLGGGAFWYMSRGGDDGKTTLVGSDREFAVEDIEQVHKIFLADRKGERVTLERDGQGAWIYNGQYRASSSVMRPLLEVVERVRIQYKPPVAAVPNMVQALATEGIKVELYDREDNNLKTYYVGGATSDERGAFMIMEGAEQPYVVEIPAWEGNVSVRFKRYGDEWRDRILFREDPDKIKYLSVEYPKQRDQSFVISKEADGSYEVTPYYEITPRISRPMKPGSVEAYLLNFERLGAEAFRNEHPGQDSVLQQVPFCSITLVNEADDTTTATLYPVLEERIVTQDVRSGEFVIPSMTIERYYVDWNGKDFMLAQHLVLQKALWGYPFFFRETQMLN